MEIKLNYKTKKIEDVKIGDYVKSFNLETEKIEPRKVIDTFRPVVKNPYKITFSDGGYIINSDKHPILILRDEKYLYKTVKDLYIGDKVLNSNNENCLITKIEKLDSNEYKSDNFYDIEVEYNNNFFAGFNGLYCNHNSANANYPFFHYEIELICQLKDTRGTYETRCRHMDVTIIINKWFMEKVLKKEDIYVFHMNEVPGLYEALGDYEKFDTLYKKYSKSVSKEHKKKINAYTLFNMFLFERSLTGRLYFVFADNITKGAWKEPVYNTNLCCFTGDTKVIVLNKLNNQWEDVEISKLVGNEENYEVTCSPKLRRQTSHLPFTAFKTGVKEVIKIKVKYKHNENAFYIKCTKDHLFLTHNREWVEAKDLTNKSLFYVKGINVKEEWYGKNCDNHCEVLEIIDEGEITDVYDLNVPGASNFFLSSGILVHNCEINLPNKPLDGSLGTPEIASCILASLNHGYIKDERVPIACEYLIRFLDNMIDYMTYDMEEVEYSSTKRRALGIGHSDLFHFLAKNKKFYNTEEGKELIHRRMESSYYNLLKASNKLAKEKGRCELYNDTTYSEGWLSFKDFDNTYQLQEDWETLEKDIKDYGLRNSTVSACAPCGNSAVVSNSTSGVEPPRELETLKEDKNFKILKLVPEYEKLKNYYTTAWGLDFNNIDYFKMLGIVQKFVDQAISTNQYTNAFKYEDQKVPLKDVYNEIITAMNSGLKTLYYQNFRANDNIDGLKDEEAPKCGSGGCEI